MPDHLTHLMLSTTMGLLAVISAITSMIAVACFSQNYYSEARRNLRLAVASAAMAIILSFTL